MSLFTKVVAKVPRRNSFNLSHESHLTANFGQLIPTLVQECFPGDKFKIRTEASVKLAPLVFPTMGRIDVYFHTFFVPHRLVFKNWEDFITGGQDGTSPNGGDPDENGTPQYPAPYSTIEDLTASGVDLLKDGTLADYMGLPTLPYQVGQAWSNLPPISMLPFLAYNKIFVDWYQDELLDNLTFNPHVGGKFSSSDLSNFCHILYRRWHKDYFTSARPDTQLGPEQSVPVNGFISSDGPFRLAQDTTTPQDLTLYRKSTGQEDLGPDYADLGAGARFASTIVSEGSNKVQYYADGLSLDEAGLLINDLRRTIKLQEWQEKNMRGGNRYIENIFHHFGVKSSDARLQRSQYLGGKKFPIVVGEQLQTVDTDGDGSYTAGQRALGSRSGVANGAGQSKHINFFCEEHGFIMTIMSIMPHVSYQQGIPRYLGARWDRFDYLWPEFGNLGEQEVYNWEIFVRRGASQPNDGTFGYQSRYADLKTGVSQIHGEFRGNTFADMAKWHNGRIFNTAPSLNSSFVGFPTSATAGGQNRIFTVVDNSLASHFYCHLFNHVKVLRMLPKYGIPSI